MAKRKQKQQKKETPKLPKNEKPEVRQPTPKGEPDINPPSQPDYEGTDPNNPYHDVQA